MLQGLLCGIGGGLVGTCVWATVAHFMGTSADFAAWVVGVCVGIGVAFGAQPKLNFLTGILAATLAAASVIVGSFAAAEFATGQKAEDARIKVATVGSHGALLALQDEIAAERDAEDLRAQADAAERPAEDFKPIEREHDVVTEARLRWARMGVTERQLYKAKLADERSAEAGRMDLPMEFRGYFQRMTTMQIVWFSLAVLTALKIGMTPGRRIDEMEQSVADAAARNNPILRGEPMGVRPKTFPPGASGPSSAPSPHIAPGSRNKAA